MTRRIDVRIGSKDGVTLGGWPSVPLGAASASPAITMANDYCDTEHHDIEPFATAFACAGPVVLLRDDRDVGNGGGRPRQDIVAWQRISGWRQAISLFRDRPTIALPARPSTGSESTSMRLCNATSARAVGGRYAARHLEAAR